MLLPALPPGLCLPLLLLLKAWKLLLLLLPLLPVLLRLWTLPLV
jgi:hypothetical protein